MRDRWLCTKQASCSQYSFKLNRTFSSLGPGQHWLGGLAVLVKGTILSQNPRGGTSSVDNLAFCEALSQWSFSRLTMGMSMVALVENRPGLARQRGITLGGSTMLLAGSVACAWGGVCVVVGTIGAAAIGLLVFPSTPPKKKTDKLSNPQ